MSKKRKTLFGRVVGLLRGWRNHTTQKHMTLFLAFVIGFLASVAAFLLHLIIREIQWLFTLRFSSSTCNWHYLVFPIIGVLLTMLFVRFVVKDNISHGITRILYAISTKRSRIKAHNCWTSVVASAITIGFGGSVGAEAPIVLTGSAIGSNLGRLFNMDNKTLMLLVGCGAAAAIAGIFKAPIAGLVFAIEVLMVDLTMASLLPILISCVTATCFTYIFVGSGSILSFTLTGEWTVERIPANIILGVCCGIISIYFIRVMGLCENVFNQLKEYYTTRLMLGGVMLSTLIFLFPALYGEGYDALNVLLNGESEADWARLLDNTLFYGNAGLLPLYAALIIIVKVFATSATNGAGGCGGTFAPSLFTGGFVGFLFARIWNDNLIGVNLPEKNFTLLGMAGVIAGVMHAPLTGIFLIAEITDGYRLLMPLIIVCVCSVLTAGIFEPHSIYAIRIAREGKLVTHHTDKAALTLMNIESVIEKDCTTVDTDMKLGNLVNVISKSQTGFIPVVDAGGFLLGEVDVMKMRHIMFRTELYERFTVGQIMTPVASTLWTNDPMEDVMNKFDKDNANFLPVVDTDNRLLGFVSRTKVLSMYRKTVNDLSNE